jgi:hypothetical protein
VRLASLIALAALAVAPPPPGPAFRFSEECGRATACTTDTDCERKCGHLPSFREIAAWEAEQRAQVEALSCRKGDTDECRAVRRNREASARLNDATLIDLEVR